MTTVAKFPNIPAELVALVDITLTGAACAGHAPLFDERGKGESWIDAEDRHDQARAICATCPVIRQCAAALMDLPLGQRNGIWAGVDASQTTTILTEERAA